MVLGKANDGLGFGVGALNESFDPLQRIAFENGLVVASEPGGALGEIRASLRMRGHLRIRGRKAKEAIMAPMFAQAEYVDQRFPGDGGHDVSTDRKAGRAAQKRNA